MKSLSYYAASDQIKLAGPTEARNDSKEICRGLWTKHEKLSMEHGFFGQMKTARMHYYIREVRKP